MLFRFILCSYQSLLLDFSTLSTKFIRYTGFIVNINITENLTWIISIIINHFRHIIIHCIKFKLCYFSTPWKCLIQNHSRSTHPKNKFVPRLFMYFLIINERLFWFSCIWPSRKTQCSIKIYRNNLFSIHIFMHLPQCKALFFH